MARSSAPAGLRSRSGVFGGKDEAREAARRKVQVILDDLGRLANDLTDRGLIKLVISLTRAADGRATASPG